MSHLSSDWIGFKILAGVIGFLMTALVLFVVLMITGNVWIMVVLALGEGAGGVILLKTISQGFVRGLAIGMLIATVSLVSVGFLFWNMIHRLLEGILQ